MKDWLGAPRARVAEIMDAPTLLAQMQNNSNPACTECLKALNFRNAFYIRRETGEILSVYNGELVQKKDVPFGYAFPAFSGILINNYFNRNTGAPPPPQNRFNLVSVLRQVEWDVYAGAKDGRLATAQPDAMAGMHAFYRPMGYKTYEMKDWLGTPRLTYSDIKRPFDPTLPKFLFSYKLDYLSATTTYPFGAEIESLSFEKSQYRFGYTGHLKDDIIRPEKGDGANYSTLFREYDPIIGRWWSIDPLRAKYAGMSPYNYAAGNPISLFDPDGRDFIKNNRTNQIEWKAEVTSKDLTPKGYEYIGFSYKGLAITKYSPYVGKNVGIEIKAGYNDDQKRDVNVRWIQTVRTNVPLGGTSSPYNDPRPKDDDKPFYFTDDELPRFKNVEGQDLLFYDRPTRDGSKDGITWQGELSLVVNFGDGFKPIVTINYGFKTKDGKPIPDKLTITSPSTFQNNTINDYNATLPQNGESAPKKEE